jgi:hypothetical protein
MDRRVRADVAPRRAENQAAPGINKRRPYPLSWNEQQQLFAKLPEYLAQMATFAVNTGCRDGEICRLRWSWEVPVPQFATSVFIVPSEYVKNGEPSRAFEGFDAPRR